MYVTSIYPFVSLWGAPATSPTFLSQVALSISSPRSRLHAPAIESKDLSTRWVHLGFMNARLKTCQWISEKKQTNKKQVASFPGKSHGKKGWTLLFSMLDSWMLAIWLDSLKRSCGESDSHRSLSTWLLLSKPFYSSQQPYILRVINLASGFNMRVMIWPPKYQQKQREWQRRSTSTLCKDYICQYMSIYFHVYLKHIHKYFYVYTHVYMYICIYTYAAAYVFMYLNMYTFTHLYVYIYIYIYIRDLFAFPVVPCKSHNHPPPQYGCGAIAAIQST